ncbi:MAG: histidine kinase [Gammaproteobacteria bacterium]|nr:histidine kinase [Gammaproteobacteria bacterium]
MRMSKPERKPHNQLPLRRMDALLLALAALLLLDAAAGWWLWRGGRGLAWAADLAAGAAALALVAALFAVNRRALVAPIRGIAGWASRIRQGDFSARLAAGPSALYGLTDDINRLAEWLESLAESKNRELLEQAARLKTQTHLVRLLYDISGDFSGGDGAGHDGDGADGDGAGGDRRHAAAALMQRSAAPLAEALDARRVAFFRFGDGDGDGDGDSDDGDPAPAQIAESAAAGADTVAGDSSTADALRCVKIPLRFGEKSHGECRVWFAAARFPLPDEFSQLLYTLGRNIGLAVERIDLHAESARLSRMRERARLANELHDSLAQTIAGLRFQVRVLDDLLRQREAAAVDAQMQTLENLLTEANAELRSLIRHFRAPVAPGGLRPAIESTIERFRTNADIALFFQDQWGDAALPKQWQTEIARIISEALANIRKHSRARNARVLLGVDEGGGYTALVEDDGDGFVVDAGAAAAAEFPTAAPAAGRADSAAPADAAHIGLSVMAQRAQSIGARLHIDSEPGEGTRIQLSLPRPPAAPPPQ